MYVYYFIYTYLILNYLYSYYTYVHYNVFINIFMEKKFAY